MLILCVFVSVCVFVGLCAYVCGQELNCNESTVCVYLEPLNAKHYIGTVHTVGPSTLAGYEGV